MSNVWLGDHSDIVDGAANYISRERTSAGTVFAASSISRPTIGPTKGTLLKKISTRIASRLRVTHERNVRKKSLDFAGARMLSWYWTKNFRNGLATDNGYVARPFFLGECYGNAET